MKGFSLRACLLTGAMVLLSTMILSCQKDDEKNGSGSYHFTAKVNGLAWSSAKSELVGTRVQDYLFVSGATGDGHEIITINFLDFPGTAGTFNIGTGEYEFHCFYSIGDVSYFVFDDVEAATGRLVVSAISANSVKGSFSFTGVNEENALVTVTDGSFHLPLFSIP